MKLKGTRKGEGAGQSHSNVASAYEHLFRDEGEEAAKFLADNSQSDHDDRMSSEDIRKEKQIIGLVFLVRYLAAEKLRCNSNLSIILLNLLIQKTYETCKSTILSLMFEDVFKPDKCDDATCDRSGMYGICLENTFALTDKSEVQKQQKQICCELKEMCSGMVSNFPVCTS